jgi:hypothetical protein
MRYCGVDSDGSGCGNVCGLFWMRWWTSWLHKMREITWKSEDLYNLGLIRGMDSAGSGCGKVCGLFWMRGWSSWLHKMREIAWKIWRPVSFSESNLLLQVSYFVWTLLLTQRQTDNCAAVVWCVWTLRTSDTIQVTTRVVIALLFVTILIFTSFHFV